MEPDWSKLTASMSGHMAEHDDFFSPAAARALEAKLKGMGKDVTLTVHPGTGHAFMGPHNALGTLERRRSRRRSGRRSSRSCTPAWLTTELTAPAGASARRRCWCGSRAAAGVRRPSVWRSAFESASVLCGVTLSGSTRIIR